jgi:heme-degrading monooxygenase HmoA
MLVALTVRHLKPDSFEDFRAAFVPDDTSNVPAGWKHFYALRNTADPNEVITFGFFDGSLDDLRAGQSDADYDERRAAADEFVESVGADGVFEVVEDRSME